MLKVSLFENVVRFRCRRPPDKLNRQNGPGHYRKRLIGQLSQPTELHPDAVALRSLALENETLALTLGYANIARLTWLVTAAGYPTNEFHWVDALHSTIDVPFVVVPDCL